MSTRVVLIRHAEAEGNLKRIFHGWTDAGITEKGHKQAKLAAECLKDIPMDILYSSDLLRTRQTAQYIADQKGLSIITHEGLREINGGDWEGLRWDGLPVLWPKENDLWENAPHLLQMPGGEAMPDFFQRVLNTVLTIIKQNEGKNIGIVTHGTAIKTLMCSFLQYELDKMATIPWYDNTAITVVDFSVDVFSVVKEGDSTHLGTEMSTVMNQKWWEEYMEKIKLSNKMEDKR